MKTHSTIYLYGAIIILVGVFLLFSAFLSFETTRITLGTSLAIGALIAFFAAFSKHRKQVQFAYHEMHALAMLVYGISVVLFCNSLEKLFFITSFLFIFYAFSEVIFSNWLFNLGQKIVFKTIIIRFLLGLAVGVGTVVAMNFTENTYEIFGILFIIVGINIMLYVPVMVQTGVHAFHNTPHIL